MRYVISGASRGLGLELVRQLLNRGETLIAGARAPGEARQLQGLASEAGGRLRVLTLNVADANSVRAFAQEVGDEPVDILINNAGLHGRRGPLAEVDYEEMVEVYRANAMGPLRLTAALLPALRRSSVRRVAHISTSMASLADNTSWGGSYGYRMSKVALNMAMRNLALELGPEGFITLCIHPGWVQTDMGGPQAPMRAEDSVRGMIRVIDGLTPAHNGRFLDWQGQELPW